MMFFDDLLNHGIAFDGEHWWRWSNCAGVIKSKEYPFAKDAQGRPYLAAHRKMNPAVLEGLEGGDSE